MEETYLPTFYCPFPVQINENVEIVHQHTLQWAVDTGLVSQGDKRYQRLEKARFAWLTSLTQPYSQLEDLQLAADWHTWLFAHDDVVDATAVGRDPEQVVAIHARFIQVLQGDEPGQFDSRVAHALADIRRRITNRTDPIWAERFAGSVEQYFQANDWEAANRYENITPDLATYIKMRQYTGAVFTCFNIIYLSLDLAPRARFLQHIYVQQLANMANHHICWVNDIRGLQKEIRENNMNNLVLVLQKRHNLTLTEAVKRAISYCDREVEAFIKLEKRLPKFDAVEQDQLAAYLNALRAWMRGHVQWYTETGRYAVIN
jgi:5-epi-alpha-selinene synthase